MSGARLGRRLSAAAGVLLMLAATAHTIGHVPLLVGTERSGSVLVEALLLAALLQTRGSTRKV